MDNTIKTIGDLRKFLEAQGGEIILGKIKISCREGQDIDFHYDFNIMQWIPSTFTDDRELSEQMIYSHMTGHSWRADVAVKEPVQELEAVPDEKADIVKDEGVIAGYKAQGAIEVYEKIFITGGRKITLE